MTATPTDVFRGKLEGDHVVVEFGRKGAGEAADQVTLTDRVALTPETAQRLVFAIEAALRRRPAAQTVQPDPAQLQRRGESPVHAAPDEAGVQAALLLSLVEALGAPVRQERSFRLAHSSLQAHRFLLTLTKSDVVGDAARRALDVCERFQMPEALQQAALAHFEGAGAVHFGFEGGTGRTMVKLYLEQEIAPQAAREAAARGEPLLQHVALKWEPREPTEPQAGAGVVTRYLWHPMLSQAGIRERLAALYGSAADGVSAAIANDIVDLACARVDATRLQYLEVLEDGNGRRSFDLNTYEAGLRVQDLRSSLNAMRDHYGVRPGQFQALYDQVKSRALGHVAGGVHRDGGDFFNIYHALA